MSVDYVLSTLLASEVRGDLLVLFHKNPGLIDTVDGVARRIGRTAAAIQTDVQELVKIGVLRQKRIGASEVIVLDRDGDRRVLESVASHLNNVGKNLGK